MKLLNYETIQEITGLSINKSDLFILVGKMFISDMKIKPNIFSLTERSTRYLFKIQFNRFFLFFTGNFHKLLEKYSAQSVA